MTPPEPPRIVLKILLFWFLVSVPASLVVGLFASLSNHERRQNGVARSRRSACSRPR